MNSTIYEGDICILYREGIPSGFVRIDNIEPGDKLGWYFVSFIVLMFPISKAIWLLDTTHIDGETFTMNGVPFRLEPIPKPSEEDKKYMSDKDPEDISKNEENEQSVKPVKVINMNEFKSNRK